MKSFTTKSRFIRAFGLSSVLVLAACSGGDDNDDEVRALEGRVTDIEMRLMVSEETDSSMAATLDAIEMRLADIEQALDIDGELADLAALLDELEERLAALEVINASEYEVVLTNASSNQPLAPAAVILHYEDYRAWSIGEPASLALETLAESGDPSMLLDDAEDVQSSERSGGILVPGAHTAVNVDAVWREDLSITLASMPVNTNDAFAGTTAWNIAGLEPGDSITALLPVYDAGTERNSEDASTIPGPAAGGEGFNAERDDIADYVARHPGVVTADDGYLESALDSSHRFDQGILHVRITRIAATE